MSNKEAGESERLYLLAVAAAFEAIDNTENEENCRAWFEAIDAVVKLHIKSGNSDPEEITRFFQQAIDLRIKQSK